MTVRVLGLDGGLATSGAAVVDLSNNLTSVCVHADAFSS